MPTLFAPSYTSVNFKQVCGLNLAANDFVACATFLGLGCSDPIERVLELFCSAATLLCGLQVDIQFQHLFDGIDMGP